ncbi:MAG: MBL fold metallo-hydrolase [Deltaproteobacteria bacterium]|nr:MBL fold metallo-hydrolase [Deltaproteobacteria bacterium]MBU54846.1 MBL fold metallo-hydrolase [Deltaproteobacteria bacterium]|tara:strand:+ start:2012 stop:3697 length:1686 start_codon:yes stop_codon:yes gene_type:complete
MAKKSWLSRWWGGKKDTPILGAKVHPSLEAHTAEFRKEVLEVTDGVYVAVGYGLANSIMLEGDEGVVIVDTMESMEAAEEVREAFLAITSKPVEAIIYTHNHTDHIFGGHVFSEGVPIDVYAHESTTTYIDRVIGVLRPAISRRSMRQFGNMLSREDFENAGIGPVLRISEETSLSLLRPNKTFSKRLEVTLAGIPLVLLHTPGETDDQISIWLPEKEVMIAADNIYKSFPNLYAIRGTPYRDVMKWVHSLDLIREYSPAHLVPCHTRPISGRGAIATLLLHYRDAIQFVHDQTLRGINNGLTPDEIVERVVLPEHLAKQPHLQEFYGTVKWSVRAIFTGYLGWFDGNPSQLDPLSAGERAKRMAALAGGEEKLLSKTKKALKAKDMQWVLELTDHLLQLKPGDKDVLMWRVQACQALAERQTSANARNYYLTCALEAQGMSVPVLRQATTSLIHPIPLEMFFRSMSVNLMAEKCLEMDECIGFRFSDTGEAYTLHIRKGIADVRPVFPKRYDIAVTIESTIWKELLAQMRNPITTFASGHIKVEGSIPKLIAILRLFEKQ